MKKIFLSILIVLSLLLLPACDMLVGQKGFFNHFEGLKDEKKDKVCNRQEFNNFLDKYLNDQITEQVFLTGVKVSCPELIKGRGFKTFNSKGVKSWKT